MEEFSEFEDVKAVLGSLSNRYTFLLSVFSIIYAKKYKKMDPHKNLTLYDMREEY